MPESPDPRSIPAGNPIPLAGQYCDQPYVVQTGDGAWLCAVTTGPGKEGAPGQHIVSMRSTDRGRTWSAPVDVEPTDGPEASYSVLFRAPSGRIYCFYNYNTENMREVHAGPPYKDGKCTRVDSLGDFVFKFSDDHGSTWSTKRHRIPIREFEIDRENLYGGAVRFGWNVGRPLRRGGTVLVPFHKVGGFGEGFFTRSEGVLLASDNLLTESDPEKIRWETLPDGDAGLRAPAGGGPIAEEQSIVTLSDGTLYVIYRTVAGRPACSYSRDGGRTWDAPRFETYADGREIRNPRAANFVWKCANGKFLYWFHNNGWNGYNNGAGSGSRNVAWLSGGVERGGKIHWSQPEIALYDPDFFSGASYPDLIEDDGRYYLLETQKTAARVHELGRAMLEGLWTQHERAEVSRDGLLLELGAERLPGEAEMPELPGFATRDYWGKGVGRSDLGGGFTLELRVMLESLAPGEPLLDARDEHGAGVALVTTANGALELSMHDGRGESRWACDAGMLEPGAEHHVVAIVDGGPRVIAFVIDGKLCDGGGARMYGWGRFSPVLRHANGAKRLRAGAGLRGGIAAVRVYGRALRVSEAVAHFRAGR